MAEIVVTGSGMGALAAAARLATAGHTVTVAERAASHGGALGRYQRDGFAFDTGPGLLHFPAVWRDVFLKTGRRSLEECVSLRRVDPAVEHRFADGGRARLPGFSLAGAAQALDDALGGGAGERWRALLGRARTTWETTRRPLLEEPLTEAARADARATDPYPGVRGGLSRRPPRTVAEVARRELRDPRLAGVLTALVREYGLDPAAAPAGGTLLAYLEANFGTWYPEGGMRALADALYERCRERRVRFLFGAEATGVLQRDGRAAGVELADGRRLPASAVVWGARPPGGGADVGGPPGLGRCTVLLALRGPRPAEAAHRTVVHATDPFGDPLRDPTVTVFRPDDVTLRPDADHHTAVLTAPVPAHGPVDWDEPGFGGRFADRLVEAADAAGLGLGPRSLWREVRTPATVERETGVPGGVVPPPALAGAGGAYLRPATTGRLAGAYRVGGLAHPGGGLVHAGMSGALAAGLIVEGPDWRGSY